MATSTPVLLATHVRATLSCMVLFASLAACGSPPKAESAPPPTVADAGAPDAPDAGAATVDAGAAAAWEEVESPVCGVRAKMLGTPKESVQTLATDQGPAKLTMLMYETADHSAAMGIMCSEVAALKTSKASNEHILDGSRDGMLKNVHGTLTSEKPFTLGGYPGRQVSVLSKGKQVNARIVFLRAKAKILTVITVGVEDSLATTFLESVTFGKP